MSIFGSICDSIFGPANASPAPDASDGTQTPAALNPASDDAPTLNAVQAAQKPEDGAPPQTVDVVDILAQKALERGGELHWQYSIVDLLKLLGLDPSLSARSQLADELGVHVAGTGSAEENLALLQAVMRKLEENGGTVPAELKG